MVILKLLYKPQQTVTPTYHRESDTYTYTLDVLLPEIPDVPEYSVTATDGDGKVTYRLTKDGTPVGSAIEVPDAYDDSSLDSRVTAVEGDVEDHERRIAGIELFFEDAAKDEGSGENLKNALDTLKEIQEYITTDGTAGSAMAEDIQKNKTAINTLTGDNTVEGSVKKTVKDAIDAQAAVDAGKYATQSALEQVKATADAAAVKSEVNAALGNKADKTDLNNYYTKEQTYDQTKINELVSGANTAAGTVANDLSAYKTASDAKFEAITAKDGAQDTAIQKNADDIAAINNPTNGILAQAKSAAATDAQTRIDTLVSTGAVGQNTAAISNLDTKVTQTNTNVNNLTGRVGALEQADTDIKADIEAVEKAHETLSGTVGGHTTAIKALEDRATAVEAEAAANTAKWKDYSTTADVNKAIDEKIAAINHKSLEDAIAANTKAVQDEASRADAEEKRIAGLVGANSEAIQANTTEIARIDGVLKAALDNNTEAIDSIKELADWVVNHDGANGVLATVNANKAAIDKLNGTAETAGSVQNIVNTAISNIPTTLIATSSKAGVVKGSADIEISSDGTMTLSDSVFSTDRLIQGSNTLVLNGGTANAPAVTA